MSDRLRRFMHLERPRTPGAPDATPEPGAASGRIDAVQRPGATAPAAPRRTGAQLDRFGPEAEPVLELAETAGRNPFTRCLGCGTDAHVSATTCPACGARLDTEAQRAFDASLWTKLQAEAAREAAAAQVRREALDRDADEAARSRRAMAEEMAREIGNRERRRLGGFGGLGGLGGGSWGGGGWGLPRDPTPLGLRILRALPAAWRIPLVAAVAVLVVGLLAKGLAGGAAGGNGFWVGAAVSVVVLLVAPPRARPRRGWGRWW